MLLVLALEGDYDGPKLGEDNKVTPLFTEELMATYKAQGKLHRRYAYQVIHVFGIILCIQFCCSIMYISSEELIFVVVHEVSR